MPIQKLEIMTTLLIEADTPQDAEAMVSSITLERIGDLIDQGEAVGRTESAKASTVPQHRLEEELKALGSDASFFAVEDANERVDA